VGYLGEARVGLLTHRLKNPPKDKRPPMVAFYSALSGEADVAQDRPRLQVDAAQLEATLAALSLQRAGYYVFVPGAEYGPAKRWPASRFAELAQSLPLPVLLLGSGKEAALCEEIAALANAAQPGRCRSLAGKTALRRPSASLPRPRPWSATTPASCMWRPRWVCRRWRFSAPPARCTRRP
jgi:heptosyltransferase-2